MSLRGLYNKVLEKPFTLSNREEFARVRLNQIVTLVLDVKEKTLITNVSTRYGSTSMLKLTLQGQTEDEIVVTRTYGQGAIRLNEAVTENSVSFFKIFFFKDLLITFYFLEDSYMC